MGFCYFLAGGPNGGPGDRFSGVPMGSIANPMAASLG